MKPGWPKSYRKAVCCETCKHCQIGGIPHDQAQFLCDINGDAPPPIDYEGGLSYAPEEVDKRRVRLRWEGYHWVDCNGVCDEHEPRGT